MSTRTSASSPPTPTARRQKACVACTLAKRACDKRQPECSRCLDRDVDCVYPRPRKRCRIAQPTAVPTHDAVALATPESQSNFWDCLNLTEPGPLIAPELNMQLTLPESSAPVAAEEPWTLFPPHSPKLSWPLLNKPGPAWFMEPATWLLEHAEDGGEIPTSMYKPFLKNTMAMMRQWALTGGNGFVHKHLYPDGLPPCVQDAYLTLTTYHARTQDTDEIVLQIAHDKMKALMDQPLVIADPPTTILNYIARVQAMFAYEMVLLLDGCIQRRAIAETWMSAVGAMAQKMLTYAQLHRASLLPSDAEASTDTQSGALPHAKALWRAWILTESVRRLWLIVGFALSVYKLLRDSWTHCHGAVMLTARDGLWEAGSATVWLEMCRANDPWMVSAITGAGQIPPAQLTEVDEFACHLWTIMACNDRNQELMKRAQHRFVGYPSRA